LGEKSDYHLFTIVDLMHQSLYLSYFILILYILFLKILFWL